MTEICAVWLCSAPQTHVHKQDQPQRSGCARPVKVCQSLSTPGDTQAIRVPEVPYHSSQVQARSIRLVSVQRIRVVWRKQPITVEECWSTVPRIISTTSYTISRSHINKACVTLVSSLDQRHRPCRIPVDPSKGTWTQLRAWSRTTPGHATVLRRREGVMTLVVCINKYQRVASQFSSNLTRVARLDAADMCSPA